MLKREYHIFTFDILVFIIKMIVRVYNCKSIKIFNRDNNIRLITIIFYTIRQL